MKVNVALCQFTPKVGVDNIGSNIEKVRNMIEKTVASENKLDLIILPECWNVELDMTTSATLSPAQQSIKAEEAIDGKSIRFLREMAQKYHTWISGGSIALKKDDGKCYNSQVIIDRNGEIAVVYDKTHLCEWAGENNCFAYGSGPKPVETEFGVLAPILCYDIRFQEIIRGYCAQGSSILLVPASFATNLNQWRVLIQARAIENQMFVLACGTCGENPPEFKGHSYIVDDAGQQILNGDFIHYMGHSMIVDPEGKILAEAGDEECMLTATIDTDRVAQVRKNVSYLESIRPQIYAHYHVD